VRASSAAATTVGRAQAPPSQPSTVPSAKMIARDPG
jgi:hypothetical protein